LIIDIVWLFSMRNHDRLQVEGFRVDPATGEQTVLEEGGEFTFNWTYTSEDQDYRVGSRVEEVDGEEVSLPARLDFESENAGSLSMAFEEGAEPSKVLSFEFMRHGSAWVSSGAYLSAEGRYTWVVQPLQFVLSVQTGAEEPTTLFIASKVVEEQEKTLWQKYSTMIMIGGMFILNMYMKTQNNKAAASGANTTGANVIPADANAPVTKTEEKPALAKKEE
jgi:hypothetical protein